MLWKILVCLTFVTLVTCGKSKRKLKVLTWDTALVAHIQNYTDRKTRAPDAIKNLDADIVCLQRVFFMDDMLSILNKSDQYPYSASSIHDGNSPPSAVAGAPCLTPEYPAFYSCFQEKCSQHIADGVAAVRCVNSKCNMSTTLDQDCASCIFHSEPAQLEAMCLGPAIGNQMNNDGLLLMSKYPLEDVKVRKYHNVSNTLVLVRGYIEAKINGLGKVVCTHLAANVTKMQDYIENLPMFTSWAEQHMNETRQLVEVFGDGTRGIVMGNLNTGPAIPDRGIVGDFTDSFNYLKNSKLRQTYRRTGNKCTYCNSNTLTDNPGTNIIDHILYRKLNVQKVKRVFDSDSLAPLSDHFGVLARVRKGKKV